MTTSPKDNPIVKALVVLFMLTIIVFVVIIGRSCVGMSINNSDSDGKQVQVDGYYKKNGQYIPPHSRSAPKHH